MRPQSGNRGSERAREQNPRFSLSRVLARRAYRSTKLDEQCHGERGTFSRQEETHASRPFPRTRTRRPASSREFPQREKDESVVEGNGRIGSNEFQYHLHHLLPDSSYRERFIGAKCLVPNNNSSSLELCNLIIVVGLLRKSFDLLPPVSLYIYIRVMVECARSEVISFRSLGKKTKGRIVVESNTRRSIVFAALNQLFVRLHLN